MGGPKNYILHIFCEKRGAYPCAYFKIYAGGQHPPDIICDTHILLLHIEFNQLRMDINIWPQLFLSQMACICIALMHYSNSLRERHRIRRKALHYPRYSSWSKLYRDGDDGCFIEITGNVF
jgi:hypothetical protein